MIRLLWLLLSHRDRCQGPSRFTGGAGQCRRLRPPTVRFAAELGYDVTMVKDATADYSDREMQAALEVNIPNYASAIVTTDELVAAISFLEDLEPSAQR